jgi:hypothetical protein
MGKSTISMAIYTIAFCNSHYQRVNIATADFAKWVSIAILGDLHRQGRRRVVAMVPRTACDASASRAFGGAMSEFF